MDQPNSPQKNLLPIKLRWVLLFMLVVIVATLIRYSLKPQQSHFKNTNYTSNVLSLPHTQYSSSNLPSPSSQLPKIQPSEWSTVITKPKDTLGSIFKRVNLSSQILAAVLQNNPHAKIMAQIKPNHAIQFKIHNKSLVKMILPLNATQSLVVSRQGNHFQTVIETQPTQTHQQYVTATIRGSLFGTANAMHLPYKLMNQMTDIFNWEIDFSKDVRAGDQFSIVYNAFYVDDKQVGTGEILALSFTNRGKVYQAVRHPTRNEYFTPEGTSLKKAFARYPLKFSHISSTFTTARFHPILHYARAHKGIDLAAPIGTPIFATGDGRIAIIDRHNAYGNMIKIEHNKTFSSIYAHMLRFAKGLSRGSFVKKGQTIGYVGQSGLATGPHCHYEFHVNQQAKNPATIPLPRGESVPPKELAAFKNHAHHWLAQLKLYQDAHQFASTGKQSKHIG